MRITKKERNIWIEGGVKQGFTCSPPEFVGKLFDDIEELEQKLHDMEILLNTTIETKNAEIALMQGTIPLMERIEQLEKEVIFWKSKCWELDTNPHCRNLEKQNEIMKEALILNTLQFERNEWSIRSAEALLKIKELENKE